MDWIINLIIVFVIVISVLKRMQDVAKKGETLGAPIPTPPVIDRNGTDHPAHQEAPKPTAQDIFRELFPEMADSREEMEKPYTARKWEPEKDFHEPVPVVKVQKEEAISEPAANFEKASASLESYMKALSAKSESLENGYALKATGCSILPARFKGNELARGIVLKEILGEPVALRERAF